VATEVTIPQLGESVTEGTITAWLVNVGDTVEADQPLFELSSDKIDTEVPSPAAGTLTEIRVQVDETVDVGTVVAVIGGGDGTPAGDDGAAGQDAGAQDAAGGAAAATPDPAADEPAPDVSGGGEASEQVEPEQAASRAQGGDAGAAGSLEEREDLAREDLADGDPDGAGAGDTPQARAAQADDSPGADPQETTGTYEATEGSVPSPQEVSASGSGGGNGQTEGVLASPIVRRMVAENDLDLSAIRATGEGGRVTREDVEAAISGRGGQQAAQEQPAAQAAQPAPQARTQPAEKPAAAPTPAGRQAQPKVSPQPERQVSLEAGPRERVEGLSRIRQRIAAKMMESMQSTAQLTTVQEADVSRIIRLRGRAKDEFKAREGVSLSPFVFLARAAVLALREPEFQTVSAQADWEAAQVKFHDYVNLGIAVDTDKGLIVPNIKNADDLTLPALARAIAEGAAKARGQGKLEMRDLEGGTFTVTNTGSRGVLIDTPILNYPEVAILATGAIQKRPIVVADDAGESIAIRDMVYLCLTYDHRLLDGADAARFVTEVKRIVETHDWAQEIGY